MRLCASRLRGRPFVVYPFRMRSAYARFNGSAVQYCGAAAGNIVGGVGREGRGEERGGVDLLGYRSQGGCTPALIMNGYEDQVKHVE